MQNLKVQEFPWFVYALVDPRNDVYFFVGRQQGAQVLGYGGGKNAIKNLIIQNLELEGLKPKKVIIKRFKTEKEAIVHEKSVIITLGQIVRGTGFLCNLNDYCASERNYLKRKAERQPKNKEQNVIKAKN